MDDRRLDRIEDKVDSISDKLGATNEILAAQHESLKQHMRRSDLLEQAMKPLQKHVAMVDGALKLIGLLAAVAAIVELLLKLL